MNRVSKLNSQRVFVLVLFVLGASALRLLPHPANVTPVAATALFAGAYFGRSVLGYLVPLLAMLVSDLVLELILGMGFHKHMFAVYGTLVLVVALGNLLGSSIDRSSTDRRSTDRRSMGKGHASLKTAGLKTAGASIGSSLLFFFTTNGSVWLLESFYPKTATGLLACYAAGLPFLERSIFGDLFYSAILFGGFALLRLRFPKLAEPSAA